MVEMNTISAMSTQSNNATDEFNEETSFLLGMLNSSGSSSGNSNGCTTTFLGMPIVGGVPQISPAGAPPPPSPLAPFLTFIGTAPSAVALYTLPVSGSNPTAQGVILQVTAPSATTANAFFPPPKNHLWITDLQFIQPVVATGFLPAPTDNPLWVANLYDLRLTAQKVSNQPTNLLGGLTSYSRDFLVTLWVGPGGTVQYCGQNPP
jgi:hypothetical protein